MTGLNAICLSVTVALKIEDLFDLLFEHSMNSQIFSREYLQSAPQLQKQAQIDTIVQTFKGQLYAAAASGKTSYMYTRPTNTNSCLSSWPPPPPEVTDAELIAGLFTRFPGCNIYYEESWTDVNPTNRTLKKGIVIDWS